MHNQFILILAVCWGAFMVACDGRIPLLTPQCLYSRNARAAAKRQVDRLTKEQKDELCERVGDPEILKDALQGFRFCPRPYDVLTALDCDQLHDYASRYLTQCLSIGRTQDRKQYFKNRTKSISAALRAIPLGEIEKLASYHNLPREIILAARRDYDRRRQRVDVFMIAERAELEAAARRHREVLHVRSRRSRARYAQRRAAASALAEIAARAGQGSAGSGMAS